MKSCSYSAAVCTSSFPAWAVGTLLLLPALGGGASAEEAEKGRAVEALQIFDRNSDQRIDAEELVALQSSFAALKKLDANGNGEIEQGELDRLNAAAATAWATPLSATAADSPARRGRALMGLQDVDKNGNRQVDPEEVADLEKLLGRGGIMDRLDLNGNGKLEPEEVKQLNERLGRRDGSLLGAFRSRFGGSTSSPAESKPPQQAPANLLNIPPPIVPPRPEDERPAPIPPAKSELEPESWQAPAPAPPPFPSDGTSERAPGGFGT